MAAYVNSQRAVGRLMSDKPRRGGKIDLREGCCASTNSLIIGARAREIALDTERVGTIRYTLQNADISLSEVISLWRSDRVVGFAYRLVVAARRMNIDDVISGRKVCSGEDRRRLIGTKVHHLF